MSADSDLEKLSLEMESRTGCDSIPTIKLHYDGICPCLDCNYRQADAVKMWKHVHFSGKHGLSFECSLKALIAKEKP